LSLEKKFVFTHILFVSLRDVQLRHARSPKLPRKTPVIIINSEIQEDIYPCSELYTNTWFKDWPLLRNGYYWKHKTDASQQQLSLCLKAHSHFGWLCITNSQDWKFFLLWQ